LPFTTTASLETIKAQPPVGNHAFHHEEQPICKRKKRQSHRDKAPFTELEHILHHITQTFALNAHLSCKMLDLSSNWAEHVKCNL